MRRFALLLVVVAAAAAMLALAGPAPAQTASASSTDLCAAATATLAQLPAAPTASASVPTAPTAFAPAVYADTVVPGRGIEISEGTIVGDVRYGAIFVGEMSGDLPGVLGASVDYTPSSPGPGVTNTIVGGQWVLCGPWGTVYGSFTGGTVQWNADGSLADVVAYTSVLGGSVNGVPVAGGAGTFSGVLDHTPLLQGLPPTVGGSLQLQVSSAPVSAALPDTGGPPLALPGAAALLLGLGVLGLGVLRASRGVERPR